jgi:hypothetical protein
VLKVAPVAVSAAMAEPLIVKPPTVVEGTERDGGAPATISPAGVQGVANTLGTHAPTWMTAADAPAKLVRTKPARNTTAAKTFAFYCVGDLVGSAREPDCEAAWLPPIL